MIISNLLFHHTDGREKYQPIYNEFFTDEFCKSVEQILEIGIGDGAGVEAWHWLFPLAQVYGFDNRKVHVPSTEIRTYIGDSTNKEDVKRFFKTTYSKVMDVIIDDGDHAPESQIATLKNFYPHLAAQGIYIMEDTGARTMEDPLVKKIQNICPSAKVQTRPVNTISGVIVIHNAA